jgi:hypothetical protein
MYNISESSSAIAGLMPIDTEIVVNEEAVAAIAPLNVVMESLITDAPIQTFVVRQCDPMNPLMSGSLVLPCGETLAAKLTNAYGDLFLEESILVALTEEQAAVYSHPDADYNEQVWDSAIYYSALALTAGYRVNKMRASMRLAVTVVLTLCAQIDHDTKLKMLRENVELHVQELTGITWTIEEGDCYTMEVLRDLDPYSAYLVLGINDGFAAIEVEAGPKTRAEVLMLAEQFHTAATFATMPFHTA